MHSATRRRRRRANINTFSGSTIGRKPKRWPIEQLGKVNHPTIDIAPDVIGVVSLHLGCIECMGSTYGVPETWCETFHLVGDCFGHVFGRSIRHVTIGPPGVLAIRCPRCIEYTLLCKQHKRFLRVAAFPYFALTLG